MNYINCKKSELSKLSVSDINQPFPNLKNVNKSSAIAEWIINWIDCNNPYGKLLPTKAEFAYSLGVSLGTIQNSLKILEDRDYIFLKQRIGAIIKNPNEITDIRKQTSKTDTAVETIKKFIISSDINIGDEFISSRKLAKITKISLSTIRCALNKLLTDGILDTVNGDIVLAQKDFKIEKNISEKTLVDKVKHDLKKYISKNFKIGEKLPPYTDLAEKFRVSIKTIHNAVKLLEKENMLLSRRGTYGTIVINTSMNSAFEPRREMSIFAPAQETAFYHYEKTQNKIKKIISENYNIGSKLPSIKEFSEALDLSPNTIRKALRNLASEGILRFTRGRYGGTYVIDMPDIEEQTFKWLAVNTQYVTAK